MLRQPTLKRTRPPLRSVALGSVLGVVAAVVSPAIFGLSSLLFAFLPMGVVLGSISFYRFRQLSEGLPPPLGKGRVRQTGAREVYLQGILIIALGAGFIFVPFLLLFIAPAEAVIGLVIGVAGGLTLSEPVFFLRVLIVERGTGSFLFTKSDLVEQRGEQTLFTSFQLEPRRGWTEK